jgi:hypothetical protein
MVMQHSLRTAAREKMLAKESGLYQTVPRNVADKRRNLGAVIGVDIQLTVAAPDVSEKI